MKKKALGLMLLVAGLGLVAQAITNTAINASTNWSAAGAWSGVGIPNGPGDYAILYRNIGTQNKITTNDISVTLGGLSIGATAANNKAVTLTPTGGSTITFTNIGGGSASILKGVNTNTAATGTDVINTPLILGVNLNITNASTYGGLNIVGDISETGSRSVSIDNPISSNLGVTLSGSNSYSGGTILNSGKLLLGHGAALGTGALTVSGDSSLGTTAAVTFSNNIAMNANLNFVNANNMVADGNISGNGTLTKSGTGTLNLGGANNTYSGGTEITTGVLQYGPGKLGSGNITMSQGTTIQGGLGAGILTNNITLLGSVNIGAQQNMNLSGVISGNFGITNKNSATTTLSGENTYTGDTTVGNATFLSVSKDSNLGAGTNINMNQNAKLTTTASFGTSKTITLNDVGANQDISAASGTTLTLNGKITGGTNGASMRLTGLGTVVYAAANDHKAGTTVASTTLRLTGAGTINDGSAKVTLNAGTVDLGGTTQTIGGLMFIGGASYLSNGTYNTADLTAAGGKGTYTGAGSLKVSSVPLPPRRAALVFQMMGALDVYVFAGQSNMVGTRTYKTDLPPALQAAQTNVFVFNGTDWVVLEPTDTGIGPEISCAYELQKALGKPIGIIKYSVGGTSLAINWNPELATNNNLYATLTNKVMAARQSRTINVKGMLWMQGESDSKAADKASAYAQNFTNLIQSARAEFKNPEMSFVAGRVNPPPAYTLSYMVRAAQEGCTSIPYA